MKFLTNSGAARAHQSLGKVTRLPLLGAAMLGTVFLGNVAAHAQISYATAGSAYTQNFDNLLPTPVPNNDTTQPATVLPQGWTFAESGNSGNTSLRLDNGNSNTGDTYLYGATNTNERALGSLASVNVQSTFGASFVNNTGVTLTTFTLNFTNEQWRDGNGALNTDAFSYSVGATSLTSGTFTPVAGLNLTSIKNGTSSVSLNGNDASNQSTPTATVTGLNWVAGQTLFIRWVDPDETGNDDGLAVDNVRFSASGTALNNSPTLEKVVFSASLNQAFSYPIVGKDLDEGDTLTYAQTGADLLPGNVTVNSDGTVSGTPDATGVFNFNVTVTDRQGASATARFGLTIVDRLDGVAPILTHVAIPATLTRDQLANTTFTGTVQDIAPTGVTPSGVNRVQIQLRRTSDGYAYNGRAFTSSLSPYYLATLDTPVPNDSTGKSNYSRSLSFVPITLDEGDYSLVVYGSDKAGAYGGVMIPFAVVAPARSAPLALRMAPSGGAS